MWFSCDGWCAFFLIAITSSYFAELRSLPALHILFKFGHIRFFEFFLADPIAKKDIIVIHQDIRHLFNQVFAQVNIFNCLRIAVFLNDVYNLAYLADHPKQLVLACFRADLLLLWMHSLSSDACQWALRVSKRTSLLFDGDDVLQDVVEGRGGGVCILPVAGAQVNGVGWIVGVDAGVVALEYLAVSGYKLLL